MKTGKVMNKDNVPKYHQLMNPLLAALHELGGSGSIEEITEAVISKLNLPDDVGDILHNPDLDLYR